MCVFPVPLGQDKSVPVRQEVLTLLGRLCAVHHNPHARLGVLQSGGETKRTSEFLGTLSGG